MNIDLLPFNALAPESCPVAQPVAGEAHTLTLKLSLGRTRSAYAPMSGVTLADGSFVHGGGGERASVLAADASAMTITFG